MSKKVTLEQKIGDRLVRAQVDLRLTDDQVIAFLLREHKLVITDKEFRGWGAGRRGFPVGQFCRIFRAFGQDPAMVLWDVEGKKARPHPIS